MIDTPTTSREVIQRAQAVMRRWANTPFTPTDDERMDMGCLIAATACAQSEPHDVLFKVIYSAVHTAYDLGRAHKDDAAVEAGTTLLKGIGGTARPYATPSHTARGGGLKRELTWNELIVFALCALLAVIGAAVIVGPL
jgi:hypothetical protein